MFINLQHFNTLYDGIISVISGQYEGTFKSKAEVRPFAESPKLNEEQINEAFNNVIPNDQKEALADPLKGGSKMRPLPPLPRERLDVRPGEGKVVDSSKPKQLEEISTKKTLNSPNPVMATMGNVDFEEAEAPMQNLIPEALKPTQDPPQLFTKLFQLGLDVLDTFGMVITTEKFRVEYLGYPKQKPFTSERTKEEDKDNKSVKIRTYADDSTIKRFQTKMDSKGESEPVPFLIPIGQAHSVLPPLNSIQEVTKNLIDRINSNKNPLNAVGGKENPIEKDDPIFRNIMKNFVKEEFSTAFKDLNPQTVDRVFERLVNSNEITPDNFLDSFGKRNEYDNTINKYREYLDNNRTNQSKNVIEFSFRPEMLSSQPHEGAEKFDNKTGWYNGKKVNSLSESIWDSVDRAERPEEEVANTKPVAQLRGDGKVSAPLNVKLDNSIIEQVGEFLTSQINEFKKVANGVASIFGQDAKASETPKNEEPQSKIQTRSCERLQDEQTEVAKQSSSQERC